MHDSHCECIVHYRFQCIRIIFSEGGNKMKRLSKSLVCLSLIITLFLNYSVHVFAYHDVFKVPVDSEIQTSTQTVDETIRSLYIETPNGCLYGYSLRVTGYLYLGTNGVITGHSLTFHYPSTYYSLSKTVSNYSTHVHITYTLSAKNSTITPTTISGSYDIYSNYLSQSVGDEEV